MPEGGYTSNGNIASYTDTVTGSWSANYDTLSRLTGAVSVSNSSINYYCWTYDSFGNRTIQSQSTVPFVADTTGNHTCTSPQNASFESFWVSYSNKTANRVSTTSQAIGGVTYDSVGNEVWDGRAQYLYDADGKICAVATAPYSGGVQMIGYLYDGAGQRVSKGTISNWSCDPSLNGFQVLSDYILGEDEKVLTEMRTSNAGGSTWDHTNVYAEGELIGTYEENGLHLYLNDPSNTKRVQVDYLGKIERSCSNLPFGDALSCTGSIESPSANHFTGKERDAESGLDYFGARYYASSMDRWMSPDPAKMNPKHVANPQKWNMYNYVLNNPLSMVDPDGNQEYYVFLPLQARANSSWTALANYTNRPNSPDHMIIYAGPGATSQRWAEANADKGSVRIFAGHSAEFLNEQAGTMAALGLQFNGGGRLGTIVGNVGNVKYDGYATVPPPTVTSGVDAVFACQSWSLPSQYSAATFFGMNPVGKDGTNTTAENWGAYVFAKTLVEGGSQSAAQSAAQSEMRTVTNAVNAAGGQGTPYSQPSIIKTPPTK